MTDEAREVIGSARRSFGFSMSILILGFIAIVLALVYRATRDGDGVADRFALEAVNLPVGAEVISVVPVDDVLSVTFSANGETMIYLVDGESGEVVREIAVQSGN